MMVGSSGGNGVTRGGTHEGIDSLTRRIQPAPPLSSLPDEDTERRRTYGEEPLPGMLVLPGWEERMFVV